MSKDFEFKELVPKLLPFTRSTRDCVTLRYGASAGSHQALASRLMNRGKSSFMHAKLMSPERKKKTPMETEAAMRERHERASSARRQLETERAARLKARGDTAASANEEAERAKTRKALQLEAGVFYIQKALNTVLTRGA